MNQFSTKNSVGLQQEISCLHYISQGENTKAHLENIERVLQAGGNWIQLRLKETSAKKVLETAIAAREMCSAYQAKLIINDHVEVAKTCNADGVHLGQEDIDVLEARRILGEDKIIGGTANTLQHCLDHLQNGVDYIGLGPLRFTSTKKKLSPVLGFSGYQDVLKRYSEHQKTVPIIAIGGIVFNDIEKLQKIGLNGIAVSGLLTHSEKPDQEIQQILNRFYVRS
ncbi:thiamine phosphate synthase [Zunongwangia endophytica]|uniref:Thiamine-phosphate synthase n=1 Tax=Zunongwangia endophytica TaxID=1808945 RepID=A0ABV8H5J5_9FLAO|nr:thiamine phosphate synthase [Zunongwangia endophytica]MDN3596044.1 thiamine phosphate synthase [Zunongwangia endophytica]